MEADFEKLYGQLRFVLSLMKVKVAKLSKKKDTAKRKKNDNVETTSDNNFYQNTFSAIRECWPPR